MRVSGFALSFHAAIGSLCVAAANNSNAQRLNLQSTGWSSEARGSLGKHPGQQRNVLIGDQTKTPIRPLPEQNVLLVGNSETRHFARVDSSISGISDVVDSTLSEARHLKEKEKKHKTHKTKEAEEEAVEAKGNGTTEQEVSSHDAKGDRQKGSEGEGNEIAGPTTPDGIDVGTDKTKSKESQITEVDAALDGDEASNEGVVAKETDPSAGTEPKEGSAVDDPDQTNEEISSDAEEKESVLISDDDAQSDDGIDGNHPKVSEDATTKGTNKSEEATALVEEAAIKTTRVSRESKEDDGGNEGGGDDGGEAPQEGQEENEGVGDIARAGEGTIEGEDSSGGVIVDMCDPESTCESCSERAREVSDGTGGKHTCVWEQTICVRVDRTEKVPAGFTCPESSPTPRVSGASSQEAQKPDDLDDEDGSGFFGIVLLGGFLAAGYVGRKKIQEKFGLGPSLSGADDDFSFAVTAATGSSGVNGGEPYNQETVPLSSATEDEWGWEDGGGDVEMATGANNRLKEEDDLQMAMALSISESPSKSTPLSAMQPKNVISTKTKSTSSPVGISSSGTSSAAVGIGVSTGAGSSRFSVASASAPTPAPAPAPAPAVSRPDDFATLLAESRPNHVPSSQYITSFSKKTKPPVPKKVEKKTAEDDIFASMGLSAKPKFSTNTVPTSSRSGAATSTSGWRSTLGAGSSSNVTSSLAAAAEVNADDLDTGSNWDDDSDLDDLLDD